MQRGEVYALLGPNGAGKTTTVEILTGVRQRTSGDVRVLGADPARDARDWRAQIGVVPQSTGEYHDVRVGEIVRHFASFYPDAQDVPELLKAVGLADLAGRRCTELSGGQRRRLDVAIGLVGSPAVIFLDEPTTGLDPQARREAWQLIREVQHRGVTTVLTTHYLDEAETLADRVGILIGGRLRAEGTPEQLGRSVGGDVEISVLVTDFALPQELADAGERRGDLLVIRTSRPTQVVAELIEVARADGRAEIPGLQVRRPSLEDTYLAFVNDAQAVGG